MASKSVAIKAEVLNDLSSRFLINMPAKDKGDPLAMCYQMEVAHWFYLDHLRPEDPTLPACNLKEFMATTFKHCSFLGLSFDSKELDKLITQWKAHKYKKPGRGAIILNKDYTKCLLVQGYPASTSWGFPKGKLEKGESDLDAAVREVYEETGFDIRGLIKEDCYLEAYLQNETPARMFIIPGVSESVVFAPKTIKEISAIKWFLIKDLPTHKKDPTPKQALGKSANNFFMIIPFMNPLKKWIASDHSPKKPKSRAKGSTAKPGISATFTNAQPSPKQQQQQQQQSVVTPTNSIGSTSQRSNTTASSVSQSASVGLSQTASPTVVIASNPGVIGSQPPQAMGTLQPAQSMITGLRPIMVESPHHPPPQQQGLQYSLFYPNFHTPPAHQESARMIRSNTPTPIPYPSPHAPFHHPHSYHSSPASHPHQSPLPVLQSFSPSMNGNQVPIHSFPSSYGTSLTFNELLEAAHASSNNVAGVWSGHPPPPPLPHQPLGSKLGPVEGGPPVIHLNPSQSWLNFALNKERIVQCMKNVRK